MYYPEQNRNSYYNGARYPEELQVRDDYARRQSSRRESRPSRHGKKRSSGEVNDPNFNMAKYGSEPRRRNTIDDYRRRSSDMVSVRCKYWTPAKTIGVFMMFVVTILVLGSIAIGGAALYYARFETHLDDYLVQVRFMSETYKSDMSVPSTSHYKYMESEFCTGVYAVFGRELKRCVLDGLQDDGGVVVHGRLQFYRRTLEWNAIDPGLGITYIRARLDHACRYQMICTRPLTLTYMPCTLLPTQIRFTVKSNFTATSTHISGRNDTNFLKAQAAVCDVIKAQIGSIYIECYVDQFETGSSDLTVIVVTVDHMMLRDNTKRDSATLSRGKYGSDHMGDEIKKLINYGGGRKLTYFSTLVLKADTVELLPYKSVGP